MTSTPFRGPVKWATGSEPTPVWLDVAREYMERYVHQNQIRQATGRPPLGAVFTGPVLATAAHALPRALDQVTCPAGTVGTFTAGGDGGGTWYVIRTPEGWELHPAQPTGPAARRARTTVDGALKLYIRNPSTPPSTWQGDHELAHALAEAKPTLG